MKKRMTRHEFRIWIWGSTTSFATWPMRHILYAPFDVPCIFDEASKTRH